MGRKVRTACCTESSARGPFLENRAISSGEEQINASFLHATHVSCCTWIYCSPAPFRSVKSERDARRRRQRGRYARSSRSLL